MGIRTATLAEIYARQGHVAEACEIYEELLAASPDDPALAGRLAALSAERQESEADDAARARVDRLRAMLARIQSRRRTR